MLDLLADPNVWAAFATLTVMEVVLGIDNIIFISVLVSRLPQEQADRARRLGLSLALIFRIALLLVISWIIGLTQPVFNIAGFEPSWKDLILILGGAFLIYKATHEMHAEIEEQGEEQASLKRQASSAFAAIIGQIIIIDMVFSIDSIVTAVGMADHVEVMIAAVIVAVGIMFVASGPVARFVAEHPTTKMLALAFLLLIGVSLVADGFGFHIPKGYIYAAMAFSVLVEAINIIAKQRRLARAAANGVPGHATVRPAVPEMVGAETGSAQRPRPKIDPGLPGPGPAEVGTEEEAMSRAFVVREYGGAEQLKVEEIEVGAPGPGQLKVRHKAIGVNFVDTYQRSGLYPMPLPFVAGNEGAGDVIAVGPGVTGFQPGDRIAYSGSVGAYADERLLPADKAVHLPDNIDYETAAAALLKGTTAFYLLHWTHPLQAGETILVHAAAGGTGQILVQWAKAIGATVIGTAGSEEKCEIVRAHGADHVINYKAEDFVPAVKEFTSGKGVDVVYDGVGKATFEPSLDCLRVRGLMVSFGNASGPVSVPKLGILADKGSLYVTRPTSASYFREPGDLRTGAEALFNMIGLGKIKISVDRRWPLAEAQKAHQALEARETTGSSVLLP